MEKDVIKKYLDMVKLSVIYGTYTFTILYDNVQFDLYYYTITELKYDGNNLIISQGKAKIILEVEGF